jgi:hypothetical protein
MKRQELLTAQCAIQKLEELKEINSRLPMREIDKIILVWKQEIEKR